MDVGRFKKNDKKGFPVVKSGFATIIANCATAFRRGKLAFANTMDRTSKARRFLKVDPSSFSLLYSKWFHIILFYSNGASLLGPC